MTGDTRRQQISAPPKAITMQDIRLVAGEGTLPAWAVLQACNTIIRQRSAASGDVRAAVIEPTDGHGYTGEYTATEFNERAWDHEKAAKNGLSAGPNVSYVRTFQACAVALRYAAKHMFSQSPATDAAVTLTKRSREDALSKILNTIATFPITNPENMDAHNMRLIALGAVQLNGASHD